MSIELDQEKSSGLKKAINRFITWLYEFFSGAALSWTSVPYLMLRRSENEKLFALALFLNLHGLSPLPPLYRLWLLPEVTPQIMYWRRKLLLWDDDLEMADLKHIGH
jgi:hypothetical protein